LLIWRSGLLDYWVNPDPGQNLQKMMFVANYSEYFFNLIRASISVWYLDFFSSVAIAFALWIL